MNQITCDAGAKSVGTLAISSARPRRQSVQVAPVDTRSSLAEVLASLETMTLDQMRELWSAQFGPPPPLRSPELMRLNLAWRVQARIHGGIDRETRQALKRKGTIEAKGLDLGAGTRLTREWQGQTYEVLVEEASFLWEGQSYASLSAVASAITGTRWNGPKFFGLQDKR